MLTTYLLQIISNVILSLLSNTSHTRESENNRPAAQGVVGELRAEASNLITMRDFIGQRMISAKFKHVYQKFFLLFCYHRFHDKHNRITTSKVKKDVAKDVVATRWQR